MTLFYHLTLFHMAVLIIAAMFAGLIDTLSGGGGLITLPVLLGVGLPPTMAVGTNKLQTLAGELVALWRFARYRHFRWHDIGWGLAWVVLGSVLGTMLLQWMHPHGFGKIIPFLMIVVLACMVFMPKLGADDVHQRWSSCWFYLFFGLLIGFYNGFFGPGTGVFWILALMLILGLNHQRAAVTMKPLNIVGNMAGLVLLIAAGKVAYLIALIMAVGQVAGSYFAAYLVIDKGRAVIRPIFMVIVSFMIVDLLLKNFA